MNSYFIPASESYPYPTDPALVLVVICVAAKQSDLCEFKCPAERKHLFLFSDWQENIGFLNVLLRSELHSNPLQVRTRRNNLCRDDTTRSIMTDSLNIATVSVGVVRGISLWEVENGKEAIFGESPLISAQGASNFYFGAPEFCKAGFLPCAEGGQNVT